VSELFTQATRVIAAPAATIFDLLADPTAHARFDGSGTVQAARSGAPARLTLGAGFGMDMKMGVPYKITNTVVEFEEGRRIAWKHFGGHVWRYVLEPQGDGSSTTVTEQFDWTTSRSRLFIKLSGYPEKNRKSMEKTLERLDALVAPKG
jgi:uncharacterized protein YndB with AHSA1/START domain